MNEEFQNSFFRLLTGYATEWRRFMDNQAKHTEAMERQADALETLVEMAKEATGTVGATKSDSKWHNASDDLLDCMAKGDCIVNDKSKKPVVTFSFWDPNKNFVSLDYMITNEKQIDAVKTATKAFDHDDTKLTKALLDIIGERL